MSSKLLLLSTSTVHGAPYLEYCTELLEEYYTGIKELLFVPYARPGGITHDEYTSIARKRFEKLGIFTTGLHELENDGDKISDFPAMFIGGGSTFLLLHELYRHQLIDSIQDAVNSGKTQYMGTSAGSNVAGLTIQTTNDMPIIYPPSFNALALVNFNLNPHYLDPDPNSKHMGETRETRIKEFHKISQNVQSVIGIREGSGLLLEDNKLKLTGDLPARLFEQGNEPVEYKAGSDLTFLL